MTRNFMLDTDTKRRIDTARDILVGKVPDPKSQVEQITIALIYKFMDDMDAESEEFGGKRKFFAKEFARYGWAKLMRSGLGGFETLNLYAEAIAKMPENPGIPLLFRDIFKNAYLPYRDPETLRMFLKVIDEFNYDHSERLGDAFEYLLSVLGSQGDAGQFRTPRHIIDFMVAIVDPKKTETVLDPACGTAGFLISSYKHIKGNADAKGNSALTPDEKGRLAQNFKGYDISPDMVRLSLVNMYLHGFAAPHIAEYDTLTSLDKWNEYADVILANPPFMTPTGGIRPHNRFAISSNRSELLFVDYIAEHLTPCGRAAVVVPDGVITGKGQPNIALRKLLLDQCCLRAIVSLPPGVFLPYARAKTSILIFSKGLKTENVWFAQLTEDGFTMDDRRKPCDANDIPRLLSLWEEKGDSKQSVSVNLDEIRNHGYDLRIGRYLPISIIDNSDPQFDAAAAVSEIKYLSSVFSSIKSHVPQHTTLETVPLGKHIQAASRPVTVQSDTTYKLLGVKWYGEGPFLRESVQGCDISATQLFRVCAGDIIYNRLFAWKGSFGVIPPELDGCYVSNEFPVFTIRDERSSSAAFIKYYLKCPTVWSIAERLSTGTSSTSRNRFAVDDFLSVPFPKIDARDQEAFVEAIVTVGELLRQTRTVEELCGKVLDKWIADFGPWVVSGWRKPNQPRNS
jgi:type I restriction-modification system DNA methylase subunit